MAHKIEKLTPEQVAQLQHSHHGKDYYDELVNYMTRFGGIPLHLK
jgi:nucleoside diphosphate kinase